MARTLPASAGLAPPSGLVLAGSRPAAAVAFESAVVDFFVDAADLLGVPKSVAAIYGLVFGSSEPLGFADIAARLDISNGSVSQGLRVLREVGALKEVSGDHDRVARFEPDLEMRKLIARFIEQRLMKQLDAGKGRLDELNKAVGSLGNGEAKILRERLGQLQGWHTKARALVPVAKTFLKLS